MIADFMPLLYVASLYCGQRIALMRGNARQGLVIDALAFNWLCCEIARVVISYPHLVPAYITIDVASAFWLSFNVRGRVAGIAEAFYVGMVLWNSAFFFMKAFQPMAHWWGLSVLSWGQVFFVMGGIVRHDLASLARAALSRLGLRRSLALGNRKDRQ